MSQPTTLTPTEHAQPTTLSTLAEQINAEHRQVETALTSGLEHARRAGELLRQAKAQCRHGEWSGWLAENFESSERTAEGYMRIAKHWPQLEKANPQRIADLTYSGAIRLLTAPKPARKPEPEQRPNRFLDSPLAVRQQTCREWWDIRALHTLMLDETGCLPWQIANKLGVSVEEIRPILNPEPPSYEFDGFCGNEFAQLYGNAVTENIAWHLANSYWKAQYRAHQEGFRRIVPRLEMCEARERQRVKQLDHADFRLMQLVEGNAKTDSDRRVWPLAVGCCVTDDMREALGIALRRFPSNSFADFFAEWCRTVQQYQIEGQSAA